MGDIKGKIHAKIGKPVDKQIIYKKNAICVLNSRPLWPAKQDYTIYLNPDFYVDLEIKINKNNSFMDKFKTLQPLGSISDLPLLPDSKPSSYLLITSSSTTDTTIVLTMDEDVVDNGADPADFTVYGVPTGISVSSLSVSGPNLTLSLTGGTITGSQDIAIGYTRGSGTINSTTTPTRSLHDFTYHTITNSLNPPTFVSAVATSPTKIDVTFDKNMDANSAPATDFAVEIAGATTNPTVQSIAPAGRVITITLDSTSTTIAAGNTIHLDYHGSGGTRPQGDGIDLADFEHPQNVVNISTQLQVLSAVAFADRIVLTMDEDIVDNGAVPADFTVYGGPTGISVSSLSTSGSNLTLSLTGGAITANRHISVGYTQSSGTINSTTTPTRSLHDFTYHTITNSLNPPTFVSAVATSPTAIDVTFSKEIDPSTVPTATPADFIVEVGTTPFTVNNITSSGKIITINLTGNQIAVGDIVKVAYEFSGGAGNNRPQDTDVNDLNDFTLRNVINNITSNATQLQIIDSILLHPSPMYPFPPRVKPVYGKIITDDLADNIFFRITSNELQQKTLATKDGQFVFFIHDEMVNYVTILNTITQEYDFKLIIEKIQIENNTYKIQHYNQLTRSIPANLTPYNLGEISEATV